MPPPMSIPLLTFLQSDLVSDFLNLNYEPTTLILALLIIPIFTYPFLPPFDDCPEMILVAVLKFSLAIQHSNITLYILDYPPEDTWLGFRPINLPLWMYCLTDLTCVVFETFTRFKCQDMDAKKTRKATKEHIKAVYRKIWGYSFLIVAWKLHYEMGLATQPIVVKGVVWTLFGGVFVVGWGPLSGPMRRARDLRVLRGAMERVVEWMMMVRGWDSIVVVGSPPGRCQYWMWMVRRMSRPSRGRCPTRNRNHHHRRQF